MSLMESSELMSEAKSLGNSELTSDLNLTCSIVLTLAAYRGLDCPSFVVSTLAFHDTPQPL